MKGRLFIVVQSATLPRAQAGRLATALGGRLLDAGRMQRVRKALHLARYGGKPVVLWWRDVQPAPINGALLGWVRAVVVVTKPLEYDDVWGCLPQHVVPKDATLEMLLGCTQAARKGCASGLPFMGTGHPATS